jgi:hypothetical protein
VGRPSAVTAAVLWGVAGSPAGVASSSRTAFVVDNRCPQLIEILWLPLSKPIRAKVGFLVTRLSVEDEPGPLDSRSTCLKSASTSTWAQSCTYLIYESGVLSGRLPITLLGVTLLEDSIRLRCRGNVSSSLNCGFYRECFDIGSVPDITEPRLSRLFFFLLR